MDKNAIVQKQCNFLKKISDILPTTTSLVNELSDLLKISNDSAYRRIRCETFLGFDEIILLCEHFNISFDNFNQTDKGIVTFTYSRISPSLKSFKEYLNRLLLDLYSILNSNQKQIIYASEDIPLFHHYQHPILASFKMFYWLHSIINIPELESEKFDSNFVDSELSETGSKIAQAYLHIPSIEIWTETTVHSTIKQIEYFWEAGKYREKKDAIIVCEELRKEILFIQKQAEKGNKIITENTETTITDYKLYFSDMEITNNCVYAQAGSLQSVYLGHFTFSTMSTMSDLYCNETLQWMNSIIKKSSLISGVSEKHRIQVFGKYLKSIDELISKINLS
jgi:hypothetical protein